MGRSEGNRTVCVPARLTQITLLPKGRRSALARDLARSGSKHVEGGLSDTPRVSDLAAGSREIAGKRAPTPCGQNQEQNAPYAGMTDSPITAWHSHCYVPYQVQPEYAVGSPGRSTQTASRSRRRAHQVGVDTVVARQPIKNRQRRLEPRGSGRLFLLSKNLIGLGRDSI